MTRFARSFLTVAAALLATLHFVVAQTSQPAPTFNDQTINGSIDVPIHAQIQATNATNYGFVTGSMPPGMRLDPSTGVITGAPTVAGTTTVRMQVADASGRTAAANVTFAIQGTNTQAVITKVSVDPGDHTFGVSLSVTYSRPVSVTLQPVIHLTIGGHAVTANYGYPDLSGTDRHVKQFFYTVSGGVQGPMTVQSPIDLRNGAIASDDGMAASLTFIPPDTSGVYVGAGQIKTAQSITFVSPTGPFVIGQPVTLDAKSSLGQPITYTLVGGDATIKGNVLTALSTETVIVGAANAGNDSYYSAYAQANFGRPQPAAQQAVVPNGHVDVAAEKPLTLTPPGGTDQPVAYSVVSGPAIMHSDTVTFTGTGNVTVRAMESADPAHPTTQTMTVAAHPVARLINISSRIHLAGSGDAAIVGFVVTGNEAKQILLRAAGDSLAQLGVDDGVTNPTLTLYDANRNVIATNTGWGNDASVAAAASAVGAFPLVPDKTDAALLVTLTPGLYTAHVTSAGSGSALFEVYDVAANDAVPTKQLINISTRAHVDANNQVFQGFVISGDQPKRVLLRAVGATLSVFGVNDGIADPALTVYAASTAIAANDDWETAGTSVSGVTIGSPADTANAIAAVGAFGLPAGSKDAALLVTLQPGLYSAVVSGSAAQSGSVLVEAYEVP